MTHRHGSERRRQYYDYSLGLLRISLELFALVAYTSIGTFDWHFSQRHFVQIIQCSWIFEVRHYTQLLNLMWVCQISLKSCVVRSRKSLPSNRWHYSSATWILNVTQVCYCCVGTKPCIPFSSSGTRLWATDYQYTDVKVHPSKPNRSTREEIYVVSIYSFWRFHHLSLVERDSR